MRSVGDGHLDQWVVARYVMRSVGGEVCNEISGRRPFRSVGGGQVYDEISE